MAMQSDTNSFSTFRLSPPRHYNRQQRWPASPPAPRPPSPYPELAGEYTLERCRLSAPSIAVATAVNGSDCVHSFGLGTGTSTYDNYCNYGNHGGSRSSRINRPHIPRQPPLLRSVLMNRQRSPPNNNKNNNSTNYNSDSSDSTQRPSPAQAAYQAQVHARYRRLLAEELWDEEVIEAELEQVFKAATKQEREEEGEKAQTWARAQARFGPLGARGLAGQFLGGSEGKRMELDEVNQWTQASVDSLDARGFAGRFLNGREEGMELDEEDQRIMDVEEDEDERDRPRIIPPPPRPLPPILSFPDAEMGD
ncbi:hypothetical protein C7999DRAFT_32640 [Corynascus novoguineensis]|uniref:Uncharacterized protein n=1 Tax=Corynascus novoguineensis TaxID=1126955 RepID=A0AAN7CRH1_9PEZI|nr:hypothetical protein C7999DRAFT_32640 [Corynascus novoguineensis]